MSEHKGVNKEAGASDLLHDALKESISAMSSCHMEPKQIACVKNPRETVYISDIDDNVKHAVEHMCAAADMLNEANSRLTDVKGIVTRLEREIKNLQAQVVSKV